MVVHVSRASDILRVLELGKTYQLRLVLAGAEEGWVVAEQIAAANTPVVVVPLTNLPENFATLGSRLDNAALLAEAGVDVIIGVPDAHMLRTLRQEAGNAVAHGLPWQTALAALTSLPARAFALSDRGVVRAGMVADLVLWSGDAFELSSRPLRVFVRGRETSLRTRQSELLERYRRLPLPEAR